MFLVAGEKSYLLTDFRPTRKYHVVKFTDGNGRQWFQLRYFWFGLPYYLRNVRETDYGNFSAALTFPTEQAARQHLAREREWHANERRKASVKTERLAD